jgi:hypothetical protein
MKWIVEQAVRDREEKGVAGYLTERSASRNVSQTGSPDFHASRRIFRRTDADGVGRGAAQAGIDANDQDL